jgi:hypothetical protein
MDWANERYVRLFVRDTTTWKLLPWQSRLLLPAILRKLEERSADWERRRELFDEFLGRTDPRTRTARRS